MGLGLCNAPLDESETGLSLLRLMALGTLDALEVPPVRDQINRILAVVGGLLL